MKIIQVTATGEREQQTLFALTDDGRIFWKRRGYDWQEVDTTTVYNSPQSGA